MVKEASDIYAQVGVTLNLVEPSVITNIPAAYNALYDQPTNMTSTWSFFDIVDIATNTCGLECYFINSFVDSPDTLAANHSAGTILGVYCTYDENDNKVWQKGMAPVGFPWNNRNPTHR